MYEKEACKALSKLLVQCDCSLHSLLQSFLLYLPFQDIVLNSRNTWSLSKKLLKSSYHI
jgi:hypothetical protein